MAEINHKNLWAALAAAQGELPVVIKASKADVKRKDGSTGFSYTYATLGDVALAAYPVLAKHGLAFIVTTESTDYGLLAVGKLCHEAGQTVGAEFPVYRGTPQEIGSGLTYARRYLLGCLSGIVTDDDDDGQAAQQSANRQSKNQGQWVEPNTGSIGSGVAASKARHPSTIPPQAPEVVSGQPDAVPDWDAVLALASSLTDLDELRRLHREAGVGRAPKTVRDDFMTLVDVVKAQPEPTIEPEPEMEPEAPTLGFAPGDDSNPWGMEPPTIERHQTP